MLVPTKATVLLFTTDTATDVNKLFLAYIGLDLKAYSSVVAKGDGKNSAPQGYVLYIFCWTRARTQTNTYTHTQRSNLCLEIELFFFYLLFTSNFPKRIIFCMLPLRLMKPAVTSQKKVLSIFFCIR